MDDEFKRTPRPRGFTFQMMNFHNEQLDEDTLHTTIIRYWINNSFTWCQRKMDTAELSQIFNIPNDKILAEINNYSKNLGGFVDPEKIKDTYYNLISMAMGFAIEDRAEASEQLNILKAAQGGQYKAFISAEVRQQQNNLMASGKAFMDIAGKLVPPGTGTNINIFTDKDKDKETIDTNYIDVTQAVHLLNQGKVSVNDDPNKLEAALEKAKELDIPEVAAKKQTSEDTTIPKEKLNGQPDPYEGRRLDTGMLTSDSEFQVSEELIDDIDDEENDHHKNRRAKEYDIDQDEFTGEA